MNICDKKCCNGCGACYNICPKNAISKEYSEDGFLYPVIDEEKCINCGLCKSVCPNNMHPEFGDLCGAYLYKNNDINVRKHSSSGGAFLEIAKKVIEQNGIVFGAEFDANNNIQHNGYTELRDVQKFCTSKYVQSDTRASFKEAYDELNAGKLVLFSGTPCQISGLKSYLSKRKCNIEKLITVDFVCHGVGSPKFWKDCLDYYEKEYKSKITSVNFRGKPRAGKLQNLTIAFQNGKRFVAPSTNLELFYYHFLKNYILRESCYDCQYSRKERVSDITLADCFKTKEEHTNMLDGIGLSFLICNSEKGRELIERIEAAGDLIAVDINDYIQPNMSEPTPKPNAYNEFWNNYENNGFYSALVTSGFRSKKNEIKNYLFKLAFMFRIDDFVKRIKK